MARIRLTWEVSKISDKFSAWVHVDKGEDGFAHHAGYFTDEYTAKNIAENTAKNMKKAIALAGKKAIVHEG